MSNRARHIAAYQQANYTMSKTQQLIMLYDAMIRNLQQAKEAITAEELETRYNCLSKVEQIITGLQCALNYDETPEMAKILDDFYFGLYMRVITLHTKPSLPLCDTLMNEISSMRQAWVEAEKSANS